MWELTEIIVMWFKHKRWRLSIFVVFILIAINICVANYPQTKSEKLIAVDKQEAIPLPIPVPTVIDSHREEFVKVQKKISHQKPEHDLVADHKRQENDHERESGENDKEKAPGNVSHFRDSLIDTLKVEGIDYAVSEKIFQNLRENLGKNQDLFTVVQSAMPQADPAEVNRVTELISKAATESINYMDSRQ